MFRRNYEDQAASLLPGVWRKGAFDLNGDHLGIDGEQESVPVVNVTLPEAGLVADELGGQLPTRAQWEKAVGVRDDQARTSPARGLAEGTGAGPEERPVAGRSSHARPERPRAAPADLQRVRVDPGHQRRAADQPVQPAAAAAAHGGRRPDVGAGTVHTYTEIATGLGKSYPWDDAKSGVGFRLVLEPR